MALMSLLRPVSAESLDNPVATSTSPFMMRETTRAAQALNSPGAGRLCKRQAMKAATGVDQPYLQVALTATTRLRSSGASSSAWRRC